MTATILTPLCIPLGTQRFIMSFVNHMFSSFFCHLVYLLLINNQILPHNAPPCFFMTTPANSVVDFHLGVITYARHIRKRIQGVYPYPLFSGSYYFFKLFNSFFFLLRITSAVPEASANKPKGIFAALLPVCGVSLLLSLPLVLLSSDGSFTLPITP